MIEIYGWEICTMDSLQTSLSNIQNRINRACASVNRDPADITLVAVSKTVDVEMVQKAYRLGIRDFGENRVADLAEKQGALPDANWHMIGRLQTNKVKDIVGKTCLIHSLDRWNLAEALHKRAANMEIDVPVLLQVNIAGEEQKAGISPTDIDQFLQSVHQLPRLKIMGFMTMAPLESDPEEVRPIFRELAEIRKRLHHIHIPNVNLKYLSMGMSQDFEVAVQEGADIIRVGTSLFHGS